MGTIVITNVRKNVHFSQSMVQTQLLFPNINSGTKLFVLGNVVQTGLDARQVLQDYGRR